MTLLFRDADDGQLGIISVESAGYDISKNELWFTTDSGVLVTFRHVLKPFAEDSLRTLCSGFLDLSCTSYLGEVDYG